MGPVGEFGSLGGDFGGDFSGIKRAVSREPLPNLLAIACAKGSRLS